MHLLDNINKKKIFMKLNIYFNYGGSGSVT